MTHKRRYAICSLLLALTMCFSMMGTMALAAEDGGETVPGEFILAGDMAEENDVDSEPEPEEPASATSGAIPGSNIRWELTEDGVLLISGSGECEPFSGAGDQPWAEVRKQIREVWFEDHDALSIADLAYWFDGCTSLAIAEVPYTTPLIGERAFADCPLLTDLFLYYQDESDFTIVPGAFTAVEPVDTNVYVVASEQTAIIHIILYDWKSDNRHIHLMDAYEFRSLANCGLGLCNCADCDWYYSYTSNGSATHAQWASCTNCTAIFWLKDVSHSMRGNTCTVCGYTAACSHPTTKTTWSGCKWYDYCRTCGKLVASGTSHDTFIYGNWEYYTISQHRQSYVCSDCRASFYRYGSHSTTTQYTQYDDTQHQVSEYCSVCASAIASAYADHHDDDGDGACDDCGYLTARFSVTVPVSLIITVSQSGEVFTADNAAIVNNSTGSVAIKEITLTAENGWTLVPFTTNMATEKVDSKQIGFVINGAQSMACGGSETLLVNTDPIAAGESLPIVYDAVISANSEAVDEQVLTVVFVVGWTE